jgi:hypothetical protein
VLLGDPVGTSDGELCDAEKLTRVSLAVTTLSQADPVMLAEPVGATLGAPSVAVAVVVSLAGHWTTIGEVKAPVGSADPVSTVEMETFSASVLVGNVALTVGIAVGQTVAFSEPVKLAVAEASYGTYVVDVALTMSQSVTVSVAIPLSLASETEADAVNAGSDA